MRLRRRPFPPSVNLICLLLTLCSTLIAGAFMSRGDSLSEAGLLTLLKHPSLWVAGLPYALCALGDTGCP